MIIFKNVLLLASAASAALTYCSSQNSGDSFDSVFGQFQSNGACSDTCAGYAFAILQGQKCWCSNTAPSDTTSVGSCDEDCAGYPSDKCGNMFKGLFGYIQLGQPSGTMAASTSSTKASSTKASTTSSPSSTTEEETSTSTTEESTSTTEESTTSTEESTTSTTSTTESSTTESSTTESSTTEASTTSTTESSTTSTSSRAPSISVLTVVGGEKTVTVSNADSSATSAPASTSSDTSAAPTFEPQEKHGDGFFDHKGKVAGVFTVVGLVGAAILGALIFFLWRRHKKNRYDDDDDDDELTVGSGGSPTGSPWRAKNAAAVGVVGRSQSTRTTLGGDRTNGGLAASPSLATSGKLRIDESSESGSHNMMRERSESSILGSMMPEHMAEAAAPGRSMAANMSQVHEVPVVDQRLDPSQMVLRYDGVDESRHSLQDDADYSRRILRVTNPDYFG
ncbi:Cell wall integrity and stress response component 4 [Yarrowia sp. C11]|nr:Cell wall integrity and stress response component 4 [Yarrowia sp. C11]KAG5364899.1 Cell wall integrity and stress response component 4 [Yarrowia sp. E02]